MNDELYAEVQDKVNEMERPTLVNTKMNKKTYSTSFRKAAYHCLNNQVPIETTSRVISSIVSELADVTLDFLPDKKTISQFAYELGIISDIQVGEVLVNNDNLTLAWDATSLDAQHVNEVHIHTSPSLSSGYVLQVSNLPGGTTEDYTEQIKNSISDVVQTYALFNGEDELVVKGKVLSHIKNTLTDRVAVNHCVVQKLQDDLNIELLELKCNVHPLDGIAHKCRSSLKKYDADHNIKGDTYGSDCCAANLIYSISKMRYKQGKGDPVGFKQFLRQENIKPGMIVRYVGNRLHVLFYLAGVFFFLRDRLLQYINTICHNKSSFRTALKKDLENDQICLQLRVIGLIGKLVTGSWMKKFYANTTNLSNLEMSPYMKKCIENLKYLENHPLESLHQKTDVFGDPMIDEDVLGSLQAPLTSKSEEDGFIEIFSLLVRSSIEVLERQLQPYLKGYLSNPTPEQYQQSKSAPPHNIYAEQTLGLTDHHFRRAPNATVGFIDGKVKSKKNKTMMWINEKSSEKQQQIITFAIKRAREIRIIKKQREANTIKIQDQRLRQKQQKTNQSTRKKVEKKVKSILHGSSLMSEFPDLEQDKHATVELIIKDTAHLTNKYFQHIWYEEEGDVTYCGKFLTVKSKAKVPNLTVAYWSEEETEG